MTGPASPGLRPDVRRDQTDDTWSALLSLDAPSAVFGRVAEPWQRSDWWSPETYDDSDAAQAVLDAHRTPTQVADSLLAGRLVPPPRRVGVDPLQAVLDAVAVLVVDGRLARARALIAGVRGASPVAADRFTRLAARIGAPAPRPQVVRPADLADVVALLTRTISPTSVWPAPVAGRRAGSRSGATWCCARPCRR